MTPFTYSRATDAAEAIRLAGVQGAKFLGGGTNLVDLMKLGVATPDVIVDVSRLPLDTVDELDGGGVRIGTNVRNADLAGHPVIRRDYPVLSRALGRRRAWMIATQCAVALSLSLMAFADPGTSLALLGLGAFLVAFCAAMSGVVSWMSVMRRRRCSRARSRG